MGANNEGYGLAASWLLRGWPRSDLLALAAVVVAVVIAVIPPLRRSLWRWWLMMRSRLGLPRHIYVRWFTRTWGEYENPYLDDKENLDLSNTYVPLSFHSYEKGNEAIVVATAVLADWAIGNLIIEGAPGSGKSTLLKAYGVGALQVRSVRTKYRAVIPFLIQLRKLARYGTHQIRIADYIVNEILVSGVGMKPVRAQQFLHYCLDRYHVLVMLDGLDEVTVDRYRAVHEAVYVFANDHSPDCPTYRARIIITCRRQNFLKLHDEWVPAIARTVCSLAPLRNSEIFSYLSKLRPKFRVADGPENFFQAVRASRTLDLHRVPLVLAMSVGLFARKDYFEIPSSISRLYGVMLEEMLDRHRFKRDPVGGALVFQAGDKYRFLREFALNAARGAYGFDEFGKVEMIDFAALLAHDLDAVSDPAAFVEEIIRHSGLLTEVGDTGKYIYAHRSIQEYLAAEELRLAYDGIFLISKAADPEWRQVIQFYSADLEQRQANKFLPQLSQRNQELAGYCLASTKVSDNVAVTVLDALQPIDGVRLAALAAATMSPRVSIQKAAIHRLERALSSPDSPLLAISGEVETMLPLLNSLAGTNAAQIAGLVPELIQHVPDDPRLVEPLWRCLTVPGIERLSASRAIVGRLLMLAISIDGFEELARQEPYTRNFLTQDIRHTSYPFRKGLEIDHNLVTLLAWADYLKVAPTKLNRYFEAKDANRLERVESDRRHSVVISLFQPARIITSMLSLAALAVATVVLVTSPGLLLHPFGYWTLAIVAAVSVIPLLLVVYIDDLTNSISDNARVRRFLVSGPEEKETTVQAHIMEFIDAKIDFNEAAVVGVVLMLTFAIGIACSPLLKVSLLIYIMVTLFGVIFYWAPLLPGFRRSRHYYLYRPNVYIDVYDDTRSRHWIIGTSR